MRAVVQRVSRASVTVEGECVGAIARGLTVLVGVTHLDGPPDAVAMADKLAGLRVFPDAEGRMNRSVSEIEGGVLVVSQFTLYASVRRGRRPSFTAAADPDRAEPLIEAIVRRLDQAGVPTATGRFGAMMSVEIVNDGPVTIVIETDRGAVL